MAGVQSGEMMRALPGELRHMRRFVLWGVKGKPTKRPYTVSNGRLKAAKPGDAAGLSDLRGSLSSGGQARLWGWVRVLFG